MEAKITNLSPAKSQIDPTPFQNLRECPNPRELPHGHLFSTAHTSNLWEHFKFELRCYLGEVFLRRKPPKIEAPHQLLHLGCGDRPFDQWVNGDLYQLRFWKTPYQWMFDLRKSFCCDDNYWDGVFTEHVLEHLEPYHAYQVIKEVFRTLKPGAHFRVIVPDVRKYIDFYQGNYNPNELLERYKNPIEGLRALSQNWHHTSLWDASLMQAFLEDVGFTEVRECKAFEGTDKKLIKDNPDAVFESLYIEAKKP